MDECLKDEVDVCNGFSPLEEESMPESIPHAELIWYLVAVLRWLFHDSICAICENLAFLPPLPQRGPWVAPDIAIIKGVALSPLSSWRVGETGPAPQIVLEILSPETWSKDLQEKPDLYAHLGIQEYFAYDPNPSPMVPATNPRLFGWRRDPFLPRMNALWPNLDGSLWSHELNSFLIPDGEMLRLADQGRQVRLTEAEAEAAARWVAERRAEALAEKLRSLGVDPDRL